MPMYKKQQENIPPAENVRKVNRRRVESINVYEITDSELDELCSGASTNHLFEAMVASLSVSLSFLASLIAANLADWRFTAFLVIMICSLIASIVFLVLWIIFRISKNSVVKKIRDRAEIPEDRRNDDTSKGP